MTTVPDPAERCARCDHWRMRHNNGGPCVKKRANGSYRGLPCSCQGFMTAAEAAALPPPPPPPPEEYVGIRADGRPA